MRSFLSQMIRKEVESLHDKIDSAATGIAGLQINQKGSGYASIPVDLCSLG
jgi:hypothetical protein